MLTPFERKEPAVPPLAEVRDRGRGRRARAPRRGGSRRRRPRSCSRAPRRSGSRRPPPRRAPRVEETGTFDRRAGVVPKIGAAPDLRTDAFALTHRGAARARSVYAVARRRGGGRAAERARRPTWRDSTTAKDGIRDDPARRRSRQAALDAYMNHLKERAAQRGRARGAAPTPPLAAEPSPPARSLSRARGRSAACSSTASPRRPTRCARSATRSRPPAFRAAPSGWPVTAPRVADLAPRDAIGTGSRPSRTRVRELADRRAGASALVGHVAGGAARAAPRGGRRRRPCRRSCCSARRSSCADERLRDAALRRLGAGAGRPAAPRAEAPRARHPRRGARRQSVAYDAMPLHGGRRAARLRATRARCCTASRSRRSSSMVATTIPRRSRAVRLLRRGVGDVVEVDLRASAHVLTEDGTRRGRGARGRLPSRVEAESPRPE